MSSMLNLKSKLEAKLRITVVYASVTEHTHTSLCRRAYTKGDNNLLYLIPYQITIFFLI